MGRWIERDLRAANLLINTETLRTYLQDSGGDCVERADKIKCSFARYDVMRMTVYGDKPVASRADWTVTIAWSGRDEPVRPTIEARRTISAVD